MSRRKAGRVPRRVDPDTDTDIEMPDLVMDVKPDLDLRSLAQGPCGRCGKIFPLGAIIAFMDHKKQGCQLLQVSDPISESKELKALSCLQCGRQYTSPWKLLCHAQWDHGLCIYQTQHLDTPEAPLLGLAEVAAAMSAVAVVAPVESKPPPVSSAARRSPTCDVCKKTLSSFSNLKVHMRSHTGERPYSCDQCSYACAQSSKLNRHKKTHRQLAPGSPSTSAKVERTDPVKIEKTAPRKSHGPGGKCEFCGKSFTNSSNLTVHRRSHTGERPYTCDQCPYACAQSSKLNRHRRTHGLGTGKTVKCPHCLVPFGLQATLDKHLRQKHPEMA